MALTPRQAHFIEGFLLDLNAAQAYRRAGYKAASDHAAAVGGNRLMTNRDIAKAIRVAMSERSARVQVDQDWVLRRLVENVERASQAVPVVDRQGRATGTYEYQGAVVNRALELIGKHVGMFGDRLEHSGTLTVNAHVGGQVDVLARIDSLTASLEELAGREVEGGPAGDGV